MGLFSSPPKVYKPAAEVDLGPDSDEPYISPNVKAPRVAGLLVKLLAWVLETPVVGWIVLTVLKRDNLVYKLVSDAEIPEPLLFTATHTWRDIPEQNVRLTKPGLSPAERVREAAGCLPEPAAAVADDPAPGFRRWTVRDFHRAYCSGQTTPVMVARRFLAAVEECSAGPEHGIVHRLRRRGRHAPGPRLHPQIPARGAAVRHGRGPCRREGRARLPAVPYHRRDAVAGRGACVHGGRGVRGAAAGVRRRPRRQSQHARAGRGHQRHQPAPRRHAQPLLPRQGLRRLHGRVCRRRRRRPLPRRPRRRRRRLRAHARRALRRRRVKPTAGRLSNDGLLPLNWTVGMPGILAATVEDTLIAYAAIADHSKQSPSPLQQPELNLPLLTCTRSMPNTRLAKYGKWFDDCSEDIRSLCGKTLQMLRTQYGWETVEVTVPEIEEMRLAHYVTMGSECTASLSNYLDNMSKSEIGWDVRIALSAYGSFSSRDYLNAQRLRSRQMYFHEKIFQTADAIVTPMTGVTAYSLQDDALGTGELDYINGAALVRYSIAGNFLGLPAITVPVGYDRGGLPVGLQFIGRPWSEATLLHLAYAMQEASCAARGSRQPKVHFDLLRSKDE